MKKFLALLLAVMMVLSLAACGGNKTPETTTAGTKAPTTGTEGPTVEIKEGDFTYKSYSSALGNNWNPHTWETNADNSILSYLETPLADMQILDSENGVYQWVFKAATDVKDVTKDHQDDLTKYNVTLPEGQTADQTTEGYVFEIKLNPEMKWENGTPINADTYIYSMKALLDPAMKNYRANLYWNGESAVAGGDDYYFAGSTAELEVPDLETAVKGEDGVYTTAEGGKIWIALDAKLSWLGGKNTLAEYVGAYGDAYFDVASFDALRALADDAGNVPLTDETLPLIVAVISVPAWGEGEGYENNYMMYEKVYPECEYDATVGCYKVDDYTIRYVTEAAIDYNYFLTSCTSNWLVYEDLYEAGKDTSGTLVTTNYATSPETTMSYGPYKMESYQADKQVVYVQNENWYGYEKTASGYLYSLTDYLVDGEYVQRYQTNKIVIDVMNDETAKQAFLKGELTDWNPPADEVVNYAASEQMYKVDETYTMSFFFNTNIDKLKEMDNSKGNQNSVVLSNINFRKAFSLSIDRADWVTATAGYKPAYALMNNLYFYDVYNDPTSSYRGSDEAMQAVCNLYGVEYGEGTPYATLKDAYNSITGYNLTEAKALMKQACDELVADGLYTAGQPIKIRIGYKNGTLDSADQNQIAKMNTYINAAAEGSGFGTITLEGVDNINDRYGDTAKGEYAIGFGAWGGAAFYPFRNMQVYCDPDNYALHEGGCWDPATETLTLTVEGEEVTMTWQQWSASTTGTGKYATADNKVKLSITAQMEEQFLAKYYRIPLAGTCAASLLSYQVKYYTDEYNIMYGFGGLELMTYNYTDAEWTDYVASQGGTLSYE